MAEAYTDITERELEILKWVALGKSNTEIAKLCGVTEQDVVHYIHDISKELNVPCRVTAGLKAIRQGLV